VDGGLSPGLLGIVNCTPDSFSDGGRYLRATDAVDHALRLLDEGADALDFGGESTRPGADPEGADEEIARVVPVIRAVRAARPGATLSVDTAKASVARAAIEAGADWVNDVTALADPAMAPLCAEAGVTVVLMHLRGTPRTMQANTVYADLLGEVEAALRVRVDHALAAGVRPERVLVDPGVGFGKTGADNAALIRAVPRWKALGHGVLIGASRKRFIGELTGVAEPADRVAGSVGAALAAAAVGADWLRVHDVAATRQALAVYRAVLR
jgi:dihydropteroate synthase